MGIIRRCANHGGACVGVEGTPQKHISTRQKRIRVCLYAHIPMCRHILVAKIIQKEHMFLYMFVFAAWVIYKTCQGK